MTEYRINQQQIRNTKIENDPSFNRLIFYTICLYWTPHDKSATHCPTRILPTWQLPLLRRYPVHISYGNMTELQIPAAFQPIHILCDFFAERLRKKSATHCPTIILTTRQFLPLRRYSYVIPSGKMPKFQSPVVLQPINISTRTFHYAPRKKVGDTHIWSTAAGGGGNCQVIIVGLFLLDGL